MLLWTFNMTGFAIRYSFGSILSLSRWVRRGVGVGVEGVQRACVRACA